MTRMTEETDRSSDRDERLPVVVSDGDAGKQRSRLIASTRESVKFSFCVVQQFCP